MNLPAPARAVRRAPVSWSVQPRQQQRTGPVPVATPPAAETVAPPAGLPAPATATVEPPAAPAPVAQSAPAPAPQPQPVPPVGTPAVAPVAPLADLTNPQPAAQQPDLTSRVEQLERTNLLQRVALTHGVPADLVSRLQGATEAEVAADAQVLMARFAAPATTTPPIPQPIPGQGPRTSTELKGVGAGADMYRDRHKKTA